MPRDLKKSMDGWTAGSTTVARRGFTKTLVCTTLQKPACLLAKNGAPGETRTPDPLLRSRLHTFIRTCRSWREAGENQQVVTTSDRALAPSSSPLGMLFVAFCHN